MEYTLLLIDTNTDYFEIIQQGLGDEKLTFFNGTGYSSFSKLVNAAIESAPTEIVFIVSYKARPTAEHVRKTLELLDQGYGLVGLHEFRFFAFKKQLFREIGLFDERYVSGGFEDDDIKHRLIEHDIAFYLTTECPAIWQASRWDYGPSEIYHNDKWFHQYYPHTNKVQHIIRLEPEIPTTAYDLGTPVPTKFLSHRLHSVASTDKVIPIMDATFINSLDDFTTIVVSDKIEDYHKMKTLLGNDYGLIFFDCSDCLSFSQTINKCAESAPTDKIIIIFGSVIPTAESINTIKTEINRGIGIASLCDFKFFGINRAVFNHVGIFDERFYGHEHSVNDYFLRCITANVSVVHIHASIAKTTSLIKIENPVFSDYKHWEAKWETPVTGKMIKKLPEHYHQYKFKAKDKKLLGFIEHSYTNSGWHGELIRKMLFE